MKSSSRPAKGEPGSAATETAPAGPSRPAVRNLLICLGLGLITLAVYSPARHYAFLKFDDNEYITGNAQVTRGITLEGLGRAFTRYHFCNWHPATTISQMLDCQLWGLNAGGHHLTNVFFHAANAVLLFLVLNGMTRATWRSAFVAALFAWHPLHVESVAWISDRKDLLSAFFLMLTLGAYLGHARRPAWHRYGLVFICYLLGLMSKATLVTLPLLLLLLDYWPLGRLHFGQSDGLPQTTCRPLKILLWEKVPFCLLAGIFGVVAIMAQRSGGALSSLERLPSLNRLANMLINYGLYCWKTIWPANLAIPYPMPPGIPLWKTLSSGLALVLATMLILRARRRSPFLAIGWFWYLIALLPVIGLVQVGAQVVADRYTYVPLIGLFIMASWGAWQVLAGSRHARSLATAAALGVLALCVISTSRQLPYWQNGITLFGHTVAVTSSNPLAHEHLAFAHRTEGRLAEAIRHYERALEIKPDFVDALNNLGSVLADQGRSAEALRLFEKALAIAPNHVEARNNLGTLFADQKRYVEAIRLFQQTLEIDPDCAEAHYNLANILADQKRYAEAIPHFERAIEIKPRFAGAHYSLGLVLAAQGKFAEAICQYQAAIASRPDYAEAHNNLANALALQGNLAGAIEHYQQALRIQPDFVESHNNLGSLLAGQGRSVEATEHFRKAVELKPDFAEAYNNLGMVLMAQERPAEAIRQFERAVEIKPGYAEAHYRLALAWQQSRKYEPAILHYQKVVELQPRNLQANNNLAWLLATCPEASLRNGDRAIELAWQAQRLSGGKRPQILDTLAAAYAEAGRFPEAVETARQALRWASVQPDASLRDGIEARLKLYEAHTPYRDQP